MPEELVTPTEYATLTGDMERERDAEQDYGHEFDSGEDAAVDVSAKPKRTRFRLVSFWDVVRQQMLRQDVQGQYHQRLANLDAAVQQFPEAASNYLLRGEFLLEQGRYEAAAADFEQAIEQAQAEYEGRRWGVVAQSVRDRALEKLFVVQRKLQQL